MDRKIEKKRWTGKRIAAIAAGGVIGIVILRQIVFPDHSRKLNVSAERLTIATVSLGEFQEFTPVYGTVLPIRTQYLSALEGGQVEEVYIESGAAVKQGDRILKLENTSLLIDIMWRESEVYDAENRLRTTRLSMEQNALSLKRNRIDLEYQMDLTRRAFERAKQLYEKDLLAAEEYELARDEYLYNQKKFSLNLESMKTDSLFRKVQVGQLENSLARMRQNLGLVKQKQDNLTVKAPIDGHLTSLTAEIGETVSRGQRIGQIDVMDAFKVRAEIDEYYLNRVEEGRYGTFEYNNKTHTLVISKVYLEVRENKFEVDLEFVGEQPSGIRRGLSLNIRLELGNLTEALLLPQGGFFQNTGGRWVYVVDPDGSTAVRREIQLGRENPEVFTVLGGLEAGERVIISPYDNFGEADILVLK
ncbi:HlyD family efflux transporter periplasmic adaptor subunit [bacterium]|nr:HlyD family efflux transporter periplasmic adaptor subunit [bacterium]